MRYLGIDYGTKRMGIAVSDEDGKIAFPLSQLSVVGFHLTVKRIQEIIAQKGVEKIVVGVPVPFGGRESAETKEARAFGEKLGSAVQLPIEFENEFLTTKMALRGGVVKNKVDAASAAILLQSHLDKIGKY